MNTLSRQNKAPQNSTLSDSLIFSTEGFYPKTALGLALVFLFFMIALHSFHAVHLIFVTVVLTLYFIHPTVRIFFLFGLPYVIYMVLFDIVRFMPLVWPTVWVGSHVHVADIYQLDLSLFGVWVASKKIPLMDYLKQFANPFWDVVIGIGYLTHSLGLLVMALLFFFKKQYRELQSLTLAFLVMNILAVATFIFFPVAPPWYVDQFGFSQPVTHILGNAARLLAVDQHLKTNFMHNLFSYTPIVFGALPSMHAGFVMITGIYAFKVYRKTWPIFLFYLGFICFGAIYTRHHYIIDLIAGIVYATVAYALTDKLLLPYLLSRKSKSALRTELLQPGFQDSPSFIHASKAEQ